MDLDKLTALFARLGAREILGRVEGLHESVLETDPTGREMRPKA